MKDRAIVMGIAPCLEEDLSKVANHELYDFMGIGLDCSDRVLFDVQHFATYHTNEFTELKERRKRAGGNIDYVTHSHQKPADRIWPLVAPSPYSGSSSFLGTQALVGMGYTKIILCGCPMQGPNQTGKKERYDNFFKGWEKYAISMFGNKVKSMSGKTMQLLGYPSKEWLSL